jgi:hypothetical protein
MEVDSMVTLELQLIEPKITFGIGILFGTTDGSSEAEGAAPFPITTLSGVIAHSGGTTNLMLST